MPTILTGEKNMEAKLMQALRELITHEIDIIHESDWWQQLIDEAVDRRLAERENNTGEK